MILAERASLEQVQSALQTAVVGCRVAVRKVSRTHDYRLLPHRLAHIHHHSSGCNYVWTHATMSFQMYHERMLAQPVQLD
jgi:hypothetical protein